MSDKIITIASYDSYIDADIAAQLLIDNGIKAAVSGGNTANIYSTPGIAQAEVMVFEDDAEKALEILRQSESEET